MEKKEKLRNAVVLAVVEDAVNQFRTRRLAKLAKLNIHKILGRKNPYLFRAIGTTRPEQLVEALLVAFLSSSDEGSFGKFFHSVAIGVSGYQGPKIKLVHFEIETKASVKAYVVKSGSYAFNSKSRSKQSDAFDKRARNFPHKKFEAIVGYAYGQKNDFKTQGKRFREVSGQAFWEEISGDPGLYMKIFVGLEKDSDQHSIAYRRAYSKALSKLVKEFRQGFVTKNDDIDWKKLLDFTSAMKA